MDLRCTLRMSGAPLDGPSWLFGDNKSVVASSALPHSALGERWNALSHHQSCEAVAAGTIRFEFLSGAQNVADVLAKCLTHALVRPLLNPLSFWKGETVESGSDERK